MSDLKPVYFVAHSIMELEQKKKSTYIIFMSVSMLESPLLFGSKSIFVNNFYLCYSSNELGKLVFMPMN